MTRACRFVSTLILLVVLFVVIGPFGINAIGQKPDSNQTSDSTAADHPKDSSALTFKLITLGQAFDENMVPLGVATYQASNGTILTVFQGGFRSPAQAQAYLEKQIAQATRVIRRGVKKDKKGKVIGERAQGLFPVQLSDIPIPAVLWTNGADYNEILASSVPTILKLESTLTP